MNVNLACLLTLVWFDIAKVRFDKLLAQSLLQPIKLGRCGSWPIRRPANFIILKTNLRSSKQAAAWRRIFNMNIRACI